MALAGMYAMDGWAFSPGDVTEGSWTIELPPVKGFAQVTTAECGDWDDGWMQLGITQIRHRPASGPDRVIDFGFVGFAPKIVYDPAMSSLTVSLRVHNWDATFMLQIFVFE
jgi:hypothetical protein